MNDFFAGLGQFVSSDKLKATSKTLATIEEMKVLFKPMSNGELPAELNFNPSAKWLAGIRFKPVPFLDIAALFQDEYDRYGIFVALLDAGAGPFKGLTGDFGYEKRAGSVGRFTGTISLPEAQRRIEMGAVKVIVPEIALDLYRNGDFKVDVGFPQGKDFSRSLCVEALPYVGWGGFYYARLSAETSAYSKVPQVTSDIGSFDSIIEAGLAVNIGYGKSFSRGVLNAGLSLTGIAILEGVNANFTANPDCNPSANGAKFNWYSGTIGLSGKVFGEVDLKVLRAVVDCQVNATANLIIESYRATDINFELEVDAHGEIEVDFGITKGKISRSFHDKMNMDFVMGKNTKALWDSCMLPSAVPSPQTLPIDEHLDWKPIIVPPAEKRPLKLYFMPQLSIGTEAGSKQVYCSAMLYLLNDLLQEGGIREWAEGLLLWTLSAYLNRNSSTDPTIDSLLNQQLNKQDLKQIECWLANDDYSAINYNAGGKDIVTFLTNFYNISICPPEIDCDGTTETKPFMFFPIFPECKLTVTQTLRGSAVPSHFVIDFMNQSHITATDLKYIQMHARKMMVEIEADDEENCKKENLLAIDTNMAALWFVDVVTMCTRILAKHALDLFLPLNEGDYLTVGAIHQAILSNQDQMEDSVAPQVSQFSLFGIRVKKDDHTPQQSVYSMIGQQFQLKRDLTGLTLRLDLLSSHLPVIMNNCTEPSGDPNTMIVDFPDCELDKIADLQDAELPNDEWSYVRALKPYADVPNTYPGKSPRIWEATTSGTTLRRKLNIFSGALGQRLADQPAGLELWRKDPSETRKLEISRDEYRLATFVEVRLITTNVSNMYVLKGASGPGQRLLGRLAKALANDANAVHLENVQIMHLDSNIWGSVNQQPFVFSGNLTKFTEPPGEDMPAFTSQSLQTFAQLLYTSGTVRSGGNFLYYEDTNNKWPQTLGEAFTAQILFTYAREAPLDAYINAADTVIGHVEETFFFLDALTSRKPAFPPGHAGLEIYRPAAKVSEAPVDYLRRMFIQIGTELEGGGSFHTQELSDVPIAPIEKVTVLPPTNITGEWNYYRVVLPIVKHAIVSPPTAGCDYPADNPYAGLGEEVKITLYPRDVLGNTLVGPSYTHTIPVNYRDFVVPPHQWPGTTLHYKLDDGGLVITLDFNSENLTEEQTSACKDSYALAYHQLIQDDVTAGITYSLDAATTHENNILVTLQEYTLNCWRELCKSTGQQIPRVVREIIIMRSVIHLDVDSPLFALNLELTITRTNEDHIDPDMRSIPEAVRATSRIPHESSKVLDSPLPMQQTIQALARYFDTYFSRKLARGAWMACEDADQLWLVGIGDNGSVTITKKPGTYIYAAAPMETMKRRRTYTIPPYPLSCTDGTGSTEDSNTETVEELDDWVQQIFTFIDEVLGAQALSVIGKVDDGISLEQIRAAKQALAEAYVSQVNHLGYLKEQNPADYHLNGARERFKQKMLEELAEAFKQDTIMQQPFDINFISGDPAEMKQIYLYGPIQAASYMGLPDGCELQDGQEFPVQARFAEAKLSLEKGIQHLTYLFDVKNSKHFAQYLAQKVKFKVTHLEYTSTEKDITTSSWLTLIEPYEIPLEKEIVIPAAIKGHPEPPLLVRHGYIDMDEAGESTSAGILEKSTKWTYYYTYKLRQEMSAQDRLKHEIVWNEEMTLAKRDIEDELPQAMAQFIHYIPCIREGLKQRPDSVEAAMAVAVLKNGLELIANKWKAYAKKTVRLASRDLLTTFDTLERPGFSSRLEIKLEGLVGPATVGAFSMSIGSFRSVSVGTGVFQFLNHDNGQYLNFSQRNLPEHLERTLIINDFNILSLKKSRIQLYETRNEQLMRCCSAYTGATAEEFVYRTQRVTLPDAATPRLSTPRVIDISNLSAMDKLPVDVHIDNLLKQLFKDGDAKSSLHSLVCSAVYKYAYITVSALRDDPNNLGQVTVPVCLKHARTLQENEESIAEFCRQLNECLRRSDGPMNEQGEFILKLSIYSDNGGNVNTLPVLILENLMLPLNKISY